MKIFKTTLSILFTLTLTIVITPIFLFDSFLIKGESMYPTLHDGQRVIVNKLLMGARIYKDFDFSKPTLSSFRLPGFRKPVPGDMVVFNYPYPDSSGKIHFRINHVFAKRCIGTPGDTIAIHNGYYKNSSAPEKILGDEHRQRMLYRRPDFVLKRDSSLAFYTLSPPGEHTWTIKDFGPMYIPSAGDSIELTQKNIFLYGKLIEYETSSMPMTEISPFYGKYVFKENYYFLAGDNVFNSNDSRYIGLIPEDFIIGIITCRIP